MSVWWKLHDLNGSMKKRANSTRCSRCNLYFSKGHKSCPHCSGMSNAELESVLRERKKNIINIDQVMILLVVILSVFVLLVYLKRVPERIIKRSHSCHSGC